jgi:hypothetical protein
MNLNSFHTAEQRIDYLNEQETQHPSSATPLRIEGNAGKSS